MLQSSAYRQKRRPRRVSSLSRSSSTRLLRRGESGPPCGVPSSTGLTRPSSITRDLRNARMSLARLLRFLPDPACAHKPGSLDPPKITLVSLAAVAERAQPLRRTAPSWRTQVPCSGRRRFTDGALAHVRTPGGPTGPAQPLLRLTRSPSTSCS